MLTNNGLKIMQCVYGGSLGGTTSQQYDFINTQGTTVQEYMSNTAVGSGVSSNVNLYRGRLVFGTDNIDITRSTYTLGNNMADFQINSSNSTVVSDTKSRVDITLTNNTGSDVTYYTYGRCNAPTDGNSFLISAYKFETPITVPANGSKNISLLFDLTNFELSVYAKPHDIKTTGITREITEQGVLQMPSGSYSLPSGVTTIDDYALYYAFYKASGLSNVNLSGLTTVNLCGLNMAFRETGLTNISFPNLTTIEESGCSNVCNRCTSLTSVSFPELTTVKLRGLENAFYNCTGLTSVTFDKLSNISADYVLSGCFTGCTSLTDVYLPALTTNSFGSSTNQFTFWLASVTNPKVHLPSNLSSVSELTSKIQSNNGTVQVLYDLPATT